MSVKKSKRLTVVLDIAERQVDDAAKTFQAVQQQLQEESQKLDEINNYYLEYHVSFEAVGFGLSGEQIARQRYFLAQLADARDKQEAFIMQCEKAVDIQKGIWHKAYLKRKSLQELIERIREDENKILSVKEEKMLDDWTTQSSQRPSVYQ